MFDVFIRYIELPPRVEAVVLPNSDSSFDVYINALLSPEKQHSALTHELKHIRENHFYDGFPVTLNEIEAGDHIVRI